ncbi:MAG: polyphosphate kinase 1 [Flavobacteriales bacterium]|nr:polyphosphate kinase 1 [Flavobacteriales bacterium]MDG1781891.1 polyphosphate kinase 1 [Flavobacteriales bacterium]MDG2246900.1 polyphosphate kinase 1 [Flavobacteriales bacterium]
MSILSNSNYVNRELSWLSFNERVLQEAMDERNPLVERFRFLGIFSNNLDEFFRVRVATLRRMAEFDETTKTDLDFFASDTLETIRTKIDELQKRYSETFELLDQELREKGIDILNETELSEEQDAYCRDYYKKTIRPNLVPLMLGGKNGFPELRDQSVYLSVALHIGESKKLKYALIEIPNHLPRFVEIPAEKGKHAVIFLEDIIRLRLHRLFAIFDARDIKAYTIKITRDAELDIDDDIDKSIVQKMQRSLDRRKKGRYVRFLYDARMPDSMLEYIGRKMRIKDKNNMIPGGIYHNKKDLMGFPDFDRNDLRFEKLPPLPHKDLMKRTSLLDQVKKRDIMLHYPYQQFTYIVDLLRESAIDPNVTEIKLNIYRVSKNSNIVNALINAAKNGKHVQVIVELQARFDEKNNIHVSNQLQEAGVQVIYGVPGLKVHSKLMMITRKEAKKEVIYGHIGTGNFHESTAKIYSDTSLLTADQRITNEISKLFDFFESNYQRVLYRHLIVSPYSTRRKFTELINTEIRNAKAGKKSWIIIKLNNLVDGGMIKKLYDASNAGVNVKLIVRGICSLIPGVKGKSENIKVTSIVGRFLEHSRVFVFSNDGNPKYFISSADWMSRNLDHRIEVSVPIYDARLHSELTDYLNMQFKDNAKSRIIDKKQKNGYVTAGRKEESYNSQEEVYKYFARKVKNKKLPED